MVKINPGPLLAMISAAGFGVQAILVKFAYSGGATAVTMLTVRFLCAAAILWSVCIARGTKLKLERAQVLTLVAMGVFGYAAMSNLWFVALAKIPASTAGLILYTYPALVWVMECVLGAEVFSLKKGAMLLVVLSGLALITGGALNANTYGMALALLSAVLYAGYIVAGGGVVKNLDPVLVSAYVCSAAGAFFLLKGLAFNDIRLDIAPHAWLAILGIVVFSTVIAVLFLFESIKWIGSTNASIISTLEPIVTVALAAAAFGERLSQLQLAGAVLILGGIITLLKMSASAQRREEYARQ